MSTADFYDALEPFYHLIYPDWPASIERQGEALTGVIRTHWPTARTLLDATCGIGTQALGLAARGFEVAASDLSPKSVARLEREAVTRGLPIATAVGDVRHLTDLHALPFDVVISCDNALPHLPHSDLPQALDQIFRCTRPGGGCIFSIRDYATEQLDGLQLRPYGIRQSDGQTFIVLQTWDCHADHYDVTFYFLHDDGRPVPAVHRMQDRYYPIAIDRLLDLMRAAGFENVQRVDGNYFQPLLIGTRPASS